MWIRPAIYNDLFPASKLLARAFKNDVFQRYLHPYLDKYPDDYYLSYLPRLRMSYVAGPDNPIFVAVEQDSHGQEKIVGIIVWRRARAQSPKLGFFRTFLIKAVLCYNYLESFFLHDRGADPARVMKLALVPPLCKHFWSGTRAEGWVLSMMAVDPDHERQGIGRKLVKLGFEQASKDGVGCSVIASHGRERFYQNCGFDQWVGCASMAGGDKNPFKGIPGGNIFFWDNGIEPVGLKQEGEE